MVDQYRAERVAGAPGRKPAKPKTVHNDTVTIRQLVNFALKRGLISEDPLKDLEIKKPKRTPQPCWTRDQVDQILAAATPPHQAPLIFLAETGARVGEAKWLSWDDVDFDHRLIHLRPKEGWKPKSGDERAVPMSDRLFDLLRALPCTGTWVFTARVTSRHPTAGRQISERRLLQYLKRLLKRLGLKGHLHTFRHSFISFAAYEGVSERVLRTWIGHVDREVLDWYFHLADPQSQAAMKRLSDAAKRSQQNGSTDSSSAQSQHKPKGGKNDESAR
jgi:integrase